MSSTIDLNSFADGQLSEKVNRELQKIYDNIRDPNTDAKKVRKLNITISFKGDDARDIINASVSTKATLTPTKPAESKIMLDFDNSGRVVGKELKSGLKGQTYIDGEGDLADDAGEKIIDFSKQKTGGSK
jgi:hypothetical protein